MEVEGLLPCSQKPATGSYLESYDFSPPLVYHFFKIHFYIIFLSTLRSHKWFAPFRFSG